MREEVHQAEKVVLALLEANPKNVEAVFHDLQAGGHANDDVREAVWALLGRGCILFDDDRLLRMNPKHAEHHALVA